MNKDLFTSPAPVNPQGSPLADRMRPQDLTEVVGQQDLVGPSGALRLLLQADSVPSILLWGPPGCGKTTLARLVANHSQARFLEYSAVAVGTRELKMVMTEAEKLRRSQGQRTILFLDEIHRFNKAQQDALLPWVERGDVTLIGATTENPSFEVNAALLSRTRLFVLAPLSPTDIRLLLERTLIAPQGLNGEVYLSPEALLFLAESSEGDARAALGRLETIALTARENGTGIRLENPVTVANITAWLQTRPVRYDKNGEEHFNIISALHKSMRNSDVDAAIYWLTRMLAGGEDPLYIVRRVVRFASEDIGLADPEALRQALAARDAVHFIGLPEGALALAQAVIYMALAPKSNALETAYLAAQREVSQGHNPPVPLHLRNATTKLMKGLGYGDGYDYAHSHPEGIAPMSCLPDTLCGHRFYEPSQRGYEAVLNERMGNITAWHERRGRKREQSTPQED